MSGLATYSLESSVLGIVQREPRLSRIDIAIRLARQRVPASWPEVRHACVALVERGELTVEADGTYSVAGVSGTKGGE